MKVLPSVYEREMIFMPYKESLKTVLNYINKNAPKGGKVLDLMCGPGHLLNSISKIRPDLNLLGVDILPKFINHAKEKYPKISFEVGDVLLWNPKESFDVVLCTGSIHHLPYDKQEDFIKRIPKMIKERGFSILSDCHIDDYSNEIQRKLAAAKMGYEYLIETTKNGADNEVIEEAANILKYDVMMEEYKTSVKKRLPIYEKYFSNIKVIKTWPLDKDTEYGDYVMICRS